MSTKCRKMRNAFLHIILDCLLLFDFNVPVDLSSEAKMLTMNEFFCSDTDHAQIQFRTRAAITVADSTPNQNPATFNRAQVTSPGVNPIKLNKM